MKCTRRNFLEVVTGFFAFLPVIAQSSQNQKTANSPSTSVDHSLLLHCIAQVESGDDDTKIGPKGERSRYQISNVVWFGITTETFYNCKGERARQVGLQHLDWLDRHLPDAILELSFREYCLAWAWHGGLDSWLHLKDSDRTRLNNYAVRVTNLYDDLKPKWRK